MNIGGARISLAFNGVQKGAYLPLTDPFPPSSSGWLEISIHLPPVAHDPLSAFLFDLGCTGIVSEDFQDHTLKAYLPFQEDRDWSRNWRRFFRSERVTLGVMIVPAWESLPPSFKGHVIRIDPGPAFGTGQHPTTRMCLEAMERLQISPSWTMLDVGTGSGILAIYGAILFPISLDV